MSTVKSFTELGSIYQNQILDGKSGVITESMDKQTVGKVREIGTPKLSKGGDDQTKKYLTKPKEGKTPDSKPEDGEAAISQKKSITESNKKMSISTFDKVFQQIVEDADTLVSPEAPALDDTVTSGGEDIDGEDEISDITSTEESPEEIVKQICSLVTKLKSVYGISDDEEDLDTVDNVEDIDAGEGDTVEEAVGTKTLPHSAGRSLQGKKNTVGKVIPLKKKVDTKLTTGDGKLSKIGSVEKLAGNKAAAKVNGTSSAVKGGNACAFSS